MMFSPLLVGCSGTVNYLREKEQETVLRRYGQVILDAYQMQGMGAQVPADAAFDLPCEKVPTQTLPPREVDGCTVKVWGHQALVELRNRTKLFRVGRFISPAIASDQEMVAFGRAVADDFKAWVKTAAFQTWLTSPEGKTMGGWGGVGTCLTCSKRVYPVGVTSCIEGPGITDGPTVILTLTDGRYFSFDAWEP